MVELGIHFIQAKKLCKIDYMFKLTSAALNMSHIEALSGKITYFLTDISRVRKQSMSTKSRDDEVCIFYIFKERTLLNSFEKSLLSSFPLK